MLGRYYRIRTPPNRIRQVTFQ